MKIELILIGENECIISVDGKTENTIERYQNEDKDVFKKRGIQQYELFVQSMKTFRHNYKVLKTITLK